MVRTFASLAALFVFAGALVAGEHRGKVTSVDAEKGTITVMVKKQERTFKVARDAKFVTQNKKLADQFAAEGLKFARFAGDKKPAVTLATEGEGDNEVVKIVTLGGKPKEPKKPKKPKTDK